METRTHFGKDDVQKPRSSYTILVNLTLALTFLFLLILVSCDDGIVCQRVDSATTTENRSVTGFDGVVFNTIGDIYIAQGPEFSFKIQGPQNVVEATSSSVDDGLLIIGTSTCFNGNANIRVDITAPDLNRIGLSGAGNIFIQDTLRTQYLSMELYGLGEIQATLYVDSLYTEVVGNGTVRYKGKVHDHTVACSGDLVLNAFDLAADTTSFTITGMADGYVRVNKKLNVTIIGTGNIYYKGNPVVQSNITGNGIVINSN